MIEPQNTFERARRCSSAQLLHDIRFDRRRIDVADLGQIGNDTQRERNISFDQSLKEGFIRQHECELRCRAREQAVAIVLPHLRPRGHDREGVQREHDQRPRRRPPATKSTRREHDDRDPQRDGERRVARLNGVLQPMSEPSGCGDGCREDRIHSEGCPGH